MTVVLDASSRPRHPEKAHRPDAPALKKPDWIRVKAPVSRGYDETRAIVRANGLHTVCEEAGCPNIGECWDKKHATFMLMGDTCTRACAFCNVKTGLPGPLDGAEPGRVAEATAKLGLKHVVVTSVDRDDLDDGGGAHFAAVIRAIRARCPITTIEVLTPDFLRKEGATSSTIISRPCLRSISPCGPARVTSPRSAYCSGSRSSTQRCSASPASWSASARSGTKYSTSWTICARPTSTSSPLASTCSRRASTIRSCALCRPRSSRLTRPSPTPRGF